MPILSSSAVPAGGQADAGPPDTIGTAPIQLLEMVFPDASNHYGTLFGGNALSLMGKAAFMAASRHAGGSVVMVATDEVVFHRPVPVGQLLELTATVTRVGRSSMTVWVDGVAEAPGGGGRSPALRGRFEMVAVDAAGRPRVIGAGV